MTIGLGRPGINLLHDLRMGVLIFGVSLSSEPERRLAVILVSIARGFAACWSRKNHYYSYL